MKRFYKDVAAEPIKSSTCFAVTLDGKPIRTPGGALLEVPSLALASRIAQEWERVEETIKPLEMMQTRLSNTALDRGISLRADIIAETAKFAQNDLLCYRAEHPQRLVALQSTHWDPVLAWLDTQRDIKLTPTFSLLGHEQAASSLAQVQRQLEAMGPFEVTAIHALTTLTGSLALAFAHALGDLSAEDAWVAATLDDAFQASEWGADDEAEAALARKEQEFLAASSFWASFSSDM